MIATSSTPSHDVVLIGAGIMSATLGTFLKELDPSLSIAIYETLDDCAQESSGGWNNAGTGHAAKCEMNYTPQQPDGSVDISKALGVNTEFDISRQFWAYLVQRGAIPDPQAFIHPLPHMSFVWGFSSKFLKHGSLADLFASLTHDNVIPLLDVARDNLALTEYLIGQVMQSADHQFAALQEFFPRAVKQDWKKAVAGQRVQTITPHASQGWFRHEEGSLEFGTELVSAADKSLVALLGASPGASTAAFIALAVLERCFDARLRDESWRARLQAIITTYGIDLKQDADACRQTRAATAKLLRIDNV
jgi:L-2-hydroxyglutarate oxidase LhgO